MATTSAKPRLHDRRPGIDSFRAEVLRGLGEQAKRLPSKYLYDSVGSALFDRICELAEYYPTRCELEILRRHATMMATMLGSGVRLVEYGSGSGLKTRVLLDHLVDPAMYIPIDISQEPLLRSAEQLAATYPRLRVLPVCADYTGTFDLPACDHPARRTVAYFPGSSIGNFEPGEAVEFMRGVAALCGQGGGLLIGVDLKKDPRVLHAAYNDRAGVTAAFNLNLLKRINRELGAKIRVDRFAHYALYDPRGGRIEMHLVSLADQLARVGAAAIPFRNGESVLTERSYKYNLDEFAALADRAGLEVRRVWTDAQRWFSVQYLAVR